MNKLVLILLLGITQSFQFLNLKSANKDVAEPRADFISNNYNKMLGLIFFVYFMAIGTEY